MDENIATVKVKLVPAAVDALGAAATRTGDSRTDTVNRALQIYDAIVAAAAHTDGARRLSISNMDGTKVADVIVVPPHASHPAPWWRRVLDVRTWLQEGRAPRRGRD